MYDGFCGVCGCEPARPFSLIAIWESGAAKSDPPTPMPRDVSIGLLIERFNSPPWMFGYGPVQDIALMNRALYAVWVFRTGQQANDKDKLTSLTREQMELVESMRTLIAKHGKSATKTPRRQFQRRRRGAI